MATRKVPLAEPSKPQLTQPVADARSQIEKRIAIGKQLLSREIVGSHTARRLESEQKIWTEYNADLLRNLFTTERFAEEYQQSPPIREMSFGEVTGVEIARRMHDCIGAELQCLDSIQNRLPLYAAVPGMAARRRLP